MKQFAIILGAALLLASPVAADQKGCPPGLAKKSPACVPPGLAKKGVRYEDHDWRVGDHWEDRDDYNRIRDWDRYGLPRLKDGEAYYRVGDNVVKVDRETMQVIGLIGMIEALAN